MRKQKRVTDWPPFFVQYTIPMVIESLNSPKRCSVSYIELLGAEGNYSAVSN